MPEEFVPDLVLDDDHFLIFTKWAPDDLPANRQIYGIPNGEPMPVVEKFGAILRHYKPDGTLCEGAISFDGPWQRKVQHTGKHFWKVERWEPLTLSPSLRCGACGDHGFIRQGKWVKA